MNPARAIGAHTAGGELRQAAGVAAPIRTAAVERNRIGAALLLALPPNFSD